MKGASMEDNDNEIIAAYVKERYPEILKTSDFALYKIGKRCNMFVTALADAFKKINVVDVMQHEESK